MLTPATEWFVYNLKFCHVDGFIMTKIIKVRRDSNNRLAITKHQHAQK